MSVRLTYLVGGILVLRAQRAEVPGLHGEVSPNITKASRRSTYVAHVAADIASSEWDIARLGEVAVAAVVAQVRHPECRVLLSRPRLAESLVITVVAGSSRRRHVELWPAVQRHASKEL